MGTKQSPRVEKGIIKWYEGDAFFLPFNIKDAITKLPIVLGESDQAVAKIFDCRERILASFEDVQQDERGRFVIHIDDELTNRFKEGKYHYKWEIHKNNNETIQTIKACGDIEVEGWCKCQK